MVVTTATVVATQMAIGDGTFLNDSQNVTLVDAPELTSSGPDSALYHLFHLVHLPLYIVVALILIYLCKGKLNLFARPLPPVPAGARSGLSSFERALSDPSHPINQDNPYIEPRN